MRSDSGDPALLSHRPADTVLTPSLRDTRSRRWDPLLSQVPAWLCLLLQKRTDEGFRNFPSAPSEDADPCRLLRSRIQLEESLFRSNGSPDGSSSPLVLSQSLSPVFLVLHLYPCLRLSTPYSPLYFRVTYILLTPSLKTLPSILFFWLSGFNSCFESNT